MAGSVLPVFGVVSQDVLMRHGVYHGASREGRSP